MNTVIRAVDVIGLPVVSIETGRDIAEIRDVIFDPNSHSLIGFTLNKRGFLSGRLKEQLDAAALVSLGRDAVMIADESALQVPSGEEKSDRFASVIDKRVLTSDGVAIGTVSGVVLSAGTNPSAVGYEIKTNDHDTSMFAPISSQIALSDDNLLLPTEASPLLRNDLAAFAAAIDAQSTTRAAQ